MKRLRELGGRARQFILRCIAQRKVMLILFTVVAAAITAHSLAMGAKTFDPEGPEYKDYNNFVIFQRSFFHLVDGADLYAAYPEEHWDYFKYTPTFALLFAPLAALPDGGGLLLWNLLNSVLLVLGVFALPHLSRQKQGLALLVLLNEAITALQNCQSNGLIAGLLVLAFAAMERRQEGRAAFYIALSAFIKPFALAALVLCLLHPGKLRIAAWGVLWAVVLAALPLVVMSPAELIGQYQSWLALLGRDHASAYGYSVMGWLSTWFHLQPDKRVVLLAGVALLLLPFMRIGRYVEPRFRLEQLAQVLIWMVIFNHMAESPTFVLAMTGVAIWYVSGERRWWDHLLFAFAFVLTSLSPTDLFPRWIFEEWVKPYALKAVPCILIAIRIFVWLMAPAQPAQAQRMARTVA